MQSELGLPIAKPSMLEQQHDQRGPQYPHDYGMAGKKRDRNVAETCEYTTSLRKSSQNVLLVNSFQRNGHVSTNQDYENFR